MKTPMQWLVSHLEEKAKEAEIQRDNSRFGLYEALDVAEALLEKEKEVMCEFADDYQPLLINNKMILSYEKS